jgi:DNA invertase Pin-like site-specific DNA recombinase
MLHIYAALAEKERALISQRTKAALAAKKAQGVKLGGLNAKGIANRNEAMERAEQLRPVLADLAGLSQGKMASELNSRGIPAPAGGTWYVARRDGQARAVSPGLTPTAVMASEKDGT